jgi:hypothetical protein
VPLSAIDVAKLDLATGALDSVFASAGVPFTIDGSFATVSTLSVAGGRLWMGGTFDGYGGQVANYIAKIDDATFALDTTFSPPSNNGFNERVFAFAVSGTSLYVAGLFTQYGGVANSANHLAKLDLTSGALDTTFSPPGAGSNGFDDFVITLAVSGSSIYAGGGFSAYRGVANSAHDLAKLDLASGALDTTFSPAAKNGFDAPVNALAVSGTSLYVGGLFGAYRGVAHSANHLAKLDLTSGALDATFSPPANNGPNSGVFALAASSSSLYVGGYFTQYRSDSANYLAKVDLATGALDTTFSPQGTASNGFNNPVGGALVVAGTSLYVGGSFTAYRGAMSSANNLAKLDLTSGALDTSFSPPGANANGFDGGVSTLAVSGSSLVVGGVFRSYRGTNTTLCGARLDSSTGALQ